MLKNWKKMLPLLIDELRSVIENQVENLRCDLGSWIDEVNAGSTDDWIVEMCHPSDTSYVEEVTHLRDLTAIELGLIEMNEEHSKETHDDQVPQTIKTKSRRSRK